MNLKKTLIVTMAVLAIFASMSVASAGFLDDLLGTPEEVSEPFNTTIDGFNFTIPAGHYELENMSMSDKVMDDMGQTHNAKTFASDDNQTFILIDVLSYDDAEAIYTGSDQMNATEKTIAGKDGYITSDGESCIFIYMEGGKGIMIAASNETVISDVLKG